MCAALAATDQGKMVVDIRSVWNKDKHSTIRHLIPKTSTDGFNIISGSAKGDPSKNFKLKPKNVPIAQWRQKCLIDIETAQTPSISTMRAANEATVRMIQPSKFVGRFTADKADCPTNHFDLLNHKVLGTSSLPQAGMREWNMHTVKGSSGKNSNRDEFDILSGVSKPGHSFPPCKLPMAEWRNQIKVPILEGVEPIQLSESRDAAEKTMTLIRQEASNIKIGRFTASRREHTYDVLLRTSELEPLVSARKKHFKKPGPESVGFPRKPAPSASMLSLSKTLNTLQRRRIAMHLIHGNIPSSGRYTTKSSKS